MDDNGGNCVPPFKGAVPCKPSTSGSLSFDTAALPDGAHAFLLVITDPTGANAAAYGPVQVRTLNQTAGLRSDRRFRRFARIRADQGLSP